MKLKDFLIGSGWEIADVARELQIPNDVVSSWDDIPEILTPVFQRILFDIGTDAEL